MADFIYKPNFDYKCKPRYNVETTEFENQAEESRLISTKKLRTWEDLMFTSRYKAEFDAVVAFYDSKYENLESFTMELGGETVTGKFIKDSFWHILRAYGIYDYGFGFKEIA